MLLKTNLFSEPKDAASAALPPENADMNLTSHGSKIFGRILLPAAARREDRFPIVLFLHGYPGTEANLDVAQVLRRAGIAVAHFSYRGVWGSHGHYRFSHLYEDGQCVLDFLHQHADEYSIDPNRIYLMVYIMVGFAAMNLLAGGAAVRGAVLLSPCDLGSRYFDDPDRYQVTLNAQKGGCFRLPNDRYLDEDVREHAAQWRFPLLAKHIPQTMPLRFIGGSSDRNTPSPQHIFPALEILQDRKMDVSYTELPDSHEYAAHRILLTETIYESLCQMDQNVDRRPQP